MSFDADALRRIGLYPFFRVIDAAPDAATVIIDGKLRLNFASNNYLGLSHHPALLDAAFHALRLYGVGVTGARPLNGNISSSQELERAVGQFVGADDAVVFPSGYHALLGAVGVLTAKGARVVYRAGSHGAIVDAAHAAADSAAYTTIDEIHRIARAGDVVVCEGTSAIDGTRSDLAQIAGACASAGATFVIDDSHGFGVAGPGGRGSLSAFAMAPGEHRLLLASLSKALASNGGVVATSRHMAERLRHEATSLHHSVGITPVAAATALTALDVLGRDALLHTNLAYNIARLTRALSKRGVAAIHHGGPVVLVECRSDRHALRAAVALLENGVFATPIVAQPGHSRLSAIRLSVTSAHSERQIEEAADAVATTMIVPRTSIRAESTA